MKTRLLTFSLLLRSFLLLLCQRRIVGIVGLTQGRIGRYLEDMRQEGEGEE